MIEIVEQGIDPKDIYYIYTCEKCQTTFKFQRSDCISGITDHMIYIYCPTCKMGMGVNNINEFSKAR